MIVFVACDLPASDAYASDQVKLEWDDQQPPIQVTRTLSLPLFTLQRVQNTSRTLRTVTGEYVTLQAQIEFRRDPQLYVYQVFMPSILLLLIGWLGMWLHVQDLQARLLLSLLALLALAGGLLQLNTRLPHVGHPKAIDVWGGMCLLFLMASLVELVFVANLYGTAPLPNDRLMPDQVAALGSPPTSTSENEVSPFECIIETRITMLNRLSFFFLFNFDQEQAKHLESFPATPEPMQFEQSGRHCSCFVSDRIRSVFYCLHDRLLVNRITCRSLISFHQPLFFCKFAERKKT